MPFCLHCPHFESEHDDPNLGAHCRVRHYHGGGKNDYQRCDCSGFEAEGDDERNDRLVSDNYRPNIQLPRETQR